MLSSGEYIATQYWRQELNWFVLRRVAGSFGKWIAIDGTKFRAVASIDTARERFNLQKYLDSMEEAGGEEQPSIDSSAVQAALEALKQHSEPEVGFMLMGRNELPTTCKPLSMRTCIDRSQYRDPDSRCLQPMAEAAKEVLGINKFQVVADAGYSNGDQAAYCQAAGMLSYVPVMRTVNNQGGGGLFGREDFRYQPDTDSRE